MSIFNSLPIELKLKIINMNTDTCIDCNNNNKYLSNNLVKCHNCSKSICLYHQTDSCKYKCKKTNIDYYLCFFCALDNSTNQCVNCHNTDKYLNIDTYKCALCDNQLCSEHSSNIINGKKCYGVNCCKYCTNFFFQ